MTERTFEDELELCYRLRFERGLTLIPGYKLHNPVLKYLSSSYDFLYETIAILDKQLQDLAKEHIPDYVQEVNERKQKEMEEGNE